MRRLCYIRLSHSTVCLTRHGSKGSRMDLKDLSALLLCASKQDCSKLDKAPTCKDEKRVEHQNWRLFSGII